MNTSIAPHVDAYQELLLPHGTLRQQRNFSWMYQYPNRQTHQKDATYPDEPNSRKEKSAASSTLSTQILRGGSISVRKRR